MPSLSAITAALERCWTAIRTVHPHVQPATIVVYLHERGDRRGHYQEDAWTTKAANKVDEVHISSHILAEGCHSVFQTLLHEACHSVASARGISDTSRQGRYHNYEFARLADELGLVVDSLSGSGFYTACLKPATVVTFENALSELEQSLDMWQGIREGFPDESGSTGKWSQVKLVCPDCARIIRASRKSINVGPIVCAPCGATFERQ